MGMRSFVPKRPFSRAKSTVLAALVAAAVVWLTPQGASTADEPPNLEGVWGMVQHDRLGAPFFIPIEPQRTAEGRRLTDEFVAKYDVENLEANGSCVEPGMPTVMWGIGGGAMEIVQQPKRITLLSELANQSRRIWLDGRTFPGDFPDQRVGYSIGRWEGDALVIETRNITEWYAPRWPHSNDMRIVERWYLKDPSELTLTGLRKDRPPPKVNGLVLVNEMTINDPVMYADEDYKVTTIYRKLEDGVMLEDGCSEGIWREALEKTAVEPNPTPQ
jgi:hypothetical protein